MAEQGIKIEEKDGFVHLSGVINEFADFNDLLKFDAPLKLNIKNVSRMNSIGIRNLLKFLNAWGDKPFEYHECPSEFVDQLNMIPALLGVGGHGKVISLHVPYECEDCEHEEETLEPVSNYEAVAKSGEDLPTKPCPKCKGKMYILTDSYFVFLGR